MKNNTIKALLILVFLFTNSYAVDDEDLANPFAELFSPASDGICAYKCRQLTPEVAEKYETRITNIDVQNGLTSCEIFPRNAIVDNERLNLVADLKDVDCVKTFEDMVVDYTDTTRLSSLQNIENTTKPALSPYDESKVSVSKFIGGLATFDEEIIDITSTIATDTIVKQGDGSYSITSSVSPDGRLYNVVDKISKENLAYYVSLFYNMDDIYELVITYVYVFMAVFFLAFYSSKQYLKKVAKKTTAHDEGWQSKLTVAVLSFTIFFIPIRYDDNYSSTFFQNTWKYFVNTSNSFADQANIVAMQTYLDKIYATTGANGIESEATLYNLLDKQNHSRSEYSTLLEECKNVYESESTFQSTDAEEIAQIESLAKGEKNILVDDISYGACRSIEVKYRTSITMVEQYEYMLERIKAAYTGASKLNENLIALNKQIDDRVQEMGWYSVVLAPTLKVLVDLSYMTSETDVPPPSNKSEEAKINDVSVDKVKGKEVDDNIWETFKKTFDFSPEIQEKTGEIFGYLAYTFVPSFSAIYDFFSQAGTKIAIGLSTFVPQVAPIVAFVSVVGGPLLYVFLTATIIKLMLTLLPLIGAFIASAIVVIMYIYELVIFTFIAPFVVAFSVTTGQGRKIIDFLVTAMVIFLKPLVIVLSMYLALFLYSLFTDVFLLLSDEQYYLSLGSASDLWDVLTFGFIRSLFHIFSVIGAIYILWKVIMQMPEYLFRLIGLDKTDNTSQLSASMQQNFNKYGFSA